VADKLGSFDYLLLRWKKYTRTRVEKGPEHVIGENGHHAQRRPTAVNYACRASGYPVYDSLKEGGAVGTERRAGGKMTGGLPQDSTAVYRGVIDKTMHLQIPLKSFDASGNLCVSSAGRKKSVSKERNNQESRPLRAHKERS